MTPTIAPIPFANVANALPATALASLTMAEIAVYDYNTLRVRRIQMPTQMNSLNTAALANTSFAVVVSAPGVGFCNWIYGLSISVSIAGRYNVQVNGNDMWVGLLPANSVYNVPIPTFGFFINGNFAVNIVNNSGSASNVITSCLYVYETQ